MHVVWIVGLAITALLLFIPAPSKTATSLKYSEWKTKLDAGEVSTVTIDQTGKATGTLKSGEKYETCIPTAIKDNELAADLEQQKVTVKATQSGSSFLSIVGSFLPLLLLVGFYFWISRRATRQVAGGLMGIGRSKAKVYDETRPTTRFSDVAGYEGAKREINEVVDFLKNPGRYAAAGATGPKGVLMVGPPGHRQDPAGSGGRRRGRGAVPRPHRVELRRVVRGRGRLTGT